MITIKNGRSRSVRTPAETETLLEADIGRLSVAEREVLNLILADLRNQGRIAPGEKSLLDVLGGAEYKTPPVDMKTFVKDPYFLGQTCSMIYPKLLEDLIELFDGGYHEAIWTGAIGYGKTFAASIGLCRVLYEISCLKDPHASYGLAKDSNIAIVALSVNENLATKVVFENIVTKIKASPYFEEQFPFEPTKKELRFPHNVWIAPRSTTDTAALGLNIIAGIIDESNFIPTKKTMTGEENRADALFNQMKRRMKSRFERQGKLPGMMFVVSSKRTNEDFTAKRIKEAFTDPSVFVRDYATWDVKPEDYFNTKRFYVLCGNADIGSKILDDAQYARYKDNVPDGAVLVDVPEDYRHDFESDLEGAIRDVAGIATVAIRPYIQRREKISEAVDPLLSHPFSTKFYDMSKGGTFLWDKMVSVRTERAPGRVEFQRNRPILNPHAARHLHIDIGLRKDALGIVMAHVEGWKDVIRRTEDGREFVEKAPKYCMDFALRVIPPIGGEIVLSEVRHLVYDLVAHGYTLTSISFDSWQSVDSIQQFTAKGLNAQTVSVDTDPLAYDTLKTALYENRIRMYDYEHLKHELTMLQEDYTGRKRKIDHPPNGSKDVSDALAGAIFTLSQQKLVQPLPIMRGSSYSPDTWMEEQRQSALAGNKEAGSKTLPPFLVGNGGGSGDWNDPWKI